MGDKERKARLIEVNDRLGRAHVIRREPRAKVVPKEKPRARLVSIESRRIRKAL